MIQWFPANCCTVYDQLTLTLKLQFNSIQIKDIYVQPFLAVDSAVPWRGTNKSWPCKVFVQTLLSWSCNTFSLIISSGGGVEGPAIDYCFNQTILMFSAFILMRSCPSREKWKRFNKGTLNWCDAAQLFEKIIRHSKIGPYHAIACHTTLLVLQTCCRIGLFSRELEYVGTTTMVVFYSGGCRQHHPMVEKSSCTPLLSGMSKAIKLGKAGSHPDSWHQRSIKWFEMNWLT